MPYALSYEWCGEKWEKDLGCALSESQEHNTALLTGYFVHVNSLELMHLTQLNVVSFSGHCSCLNSSLITATLYTASMTLLDLTYA